MRQICDLGVKVIVVRPGISTPHFRFDQELFKGNTISSPGGSIVCLVSPKKSYKLNSLGENYFWPRPFPNMGKNLTFDRKVVETPFFYQNDRI